MRTLLLTARILSSIFRPSYYPTVGMIFLLTLSYLKLLPWSIKVWLLSIVYCSTIVVPTLLYYLYRQLSHRPHSHFALRTRRTAPYLIHLICYVACIYVLDLWSMPRCISAIIFVSLTLQIICIFINLWWKISMHAAGSGAVIGAIAAYSHLFGFYPIWWLSAAILLSGLVMSSRLVLRQHTLGQVIGGCLIGVITAYIGVLI